MMIVPDTQKMLAAGLTITGLFGGTYLPNPG